MQDDIKSLSHSKWRCKYHIVFAPKYRRQEIYGALKADIGQILRKLCEEKGVEIIEAQACPDHIHMVELRWFFQFQQLQERYQQCKDFSDW